MSFLWKKPKYKKRFAVFGMLCLVLFVSLAPSLPASAAGTLSGFSESLKKFFFFKVTLPKAQNGWCLST